MHNFFFVFGLGLIAYALLFAAGGLSALDTRNYDYRPAQISFLAGVFCIAIAVAIGG